MSSVMVVSRFEVGGAELGQGRSVQALRRTGKSARLFETSECFPSAVRTGESGLAAGSRPPLSRQPLPRLVLPVAERPRRLPSSCAAISSSLKPSPARNRYGPICGISRPRAATVSRVSMSVNRASAPASGRFASPSRSPPSSSVPESETVGVSGLADRPQDRAHPQVEAVREVALPELLRRRQVRNVPQHPQPRLAAASSRSAEAMVAHAAALARIGPSRRAISSPRTASAASPSPARR